MISNAVDILRKRAREKRGQLFLSSFSITPDTRILDLGGGDGSHIASILQQTLVNPANVYVADIESFSEMVEKEFNFKYVTIPESGRLPFPDKYFDIVFCSSVIEHVTIPKEDVWKLQSGKSFVNHSRLRQQKFAVEISRLGKKYFVQTPNKWFVIESHTWLPFVGWMPRRLLIPILFFTNKVWVKSTNPDWHLLTAKEIRELFPQAVIKFEKFAGFRKSIIAIMN